MISILLFLILLVLVLGGFLHIVSEVIALVAGLVIFAVGYILYKVFRKR